MVVKFHWLKGGLLHWLLSVELIIHMVGGEEWKPPTAKKKKRKIRGHGRHRAGCVRAAVHLCYKALSDEGHPEFHEGLKNNIHTFFFFFFGDNQPSTDGLISRVFCQYGILFSRRIIVIKASVKSSFSDGQQPR